MNERNKKNYILIGMPTSGKSTVGVILAKIMGMDFLDTDLLIQQREGMLLSEIIEKKGIDGFLQCEEDALLSIKKDNTVIATGGSAVYSKPAMDYLHKNGIVCYLKVEKEELFSRLNDVKERGVVLRDGESIDEMFENRSVLYENYADVVIDEEDKTIEGTVQATIEAINRILQK